MNSVSAQPRHVVVVADREDMRGVLECLVEEAGHRPTAWASCPDPSRLTEVGAEALVIDLPFDDHGSPGVALMRAIRDGDGTRHLPVVASIDILDGGVEPATLLAFDQVALLPKPFDVDEFERAMQTALDGLTANR